MFLLSYPKQRCPYMPGSEPSLISKRISNLSLKLKPSAWLKKLQYSEFLMDNCKFLHGHIIGSIMFCGFDHFRRIVT
jgi:hypothetical protein